MTARTSHNAHLARFEGVFRALYEDVRRQAARVGASDPDDVAAEVFTALWRHLDEVEPGMERAWAFSAVRRQTANQRRSATRQSRVATAVGGLAESQPGWSPGSTATDPRVRRALDVLSATDQEILLLATWSHATPLEIARILGISRTAAAVRLHRARRRFRAVFADDRPAVVAPCISSGGIDVS